MWTYSGKWRRPPQASFTSWWPTSSRLYSEFNLFISAWC
jgi:hypothetical protein